MSDDERLYKLRRRLDAWSDAVQPRAGQFVDERRDLLARRITNAQLSGLTNVVGVAPTYQSIKRYVTHQADKAGRAGRDEVKTYWLALGQELDRLRREAEQMWAEVPGGPPAGTPAARAALDEWHCRLVGEYVQHLVAHSMATRSSPRR